MSNQTQLPNELQVAPPHLLNSTSLTANAVVKTPANQTSYIWNAKIRLGVPNTGRAIRLHIGKLPTAQMSLRAGSRFDFNVDPNTGLININFKLEGSGKVSNYNTSKGGVQINITPDLSYKHLKFKDGRVTATFNSQKRTVEIKAGHKLIPLQEEPTQKPVDDHIDVIESEPMNRIFAEQKVLLTQYGSRMRFVLDGNGHIDGAHCPSVYIGQDTQP